MEEKKDIGTFVEDKLANGKIAPNPKLWDRLNKTWDNEIDRRKRKFFYWSAAGGILLSLGLLSLVLNHFLQPKIETDQAIPVTRKPLNTPSELEKNKVIDKGIEKDSLEFYQSNETHLILDPSDEELKEIEERGHETKKDKTKSDSVEETFNVTTNYYYYSSEDEKQIVTTDKHLIDSLMTSKEYKLDSTTTRKTDTLKTKQ